MDRDASEPGTTDSGDRDGDRDELADDDASDEQPSSFDAVLRAVAAAPSVDPDGPKRPPLGPGSVVDAAFRVESELGSGSMGVVYLATDIALDRPVALKVHNSGADYLGGRMWREAKAMARLSHPNVITVHEVGVFADRVYIAMELVDGGTVRQWLQTPRSWREVLDVFEQAALGLAAAHDVGLVHRDFKPTNVLVGHDGRVRVADFGLARSVDALSHEVSATLSKGTRDKSPTLDQAVTATGTIVGTPVYMAPELLAGGPATQRSDQYSFWVSLHEALFGTRPEGRSRPGGSSGDAHGQRTKPRPAATGTIPTWVRTMLARGLSENPDERFEDMDAVIVALTSDPRGRRRVLMVGAVASAAVLSVVGLDALAERRGKAWCHERADAISEALSEPVRAELSAAFGASELPYAASTMQSLEPVLQRYAEQWRASFSTTCIASEVEHTVPQTRWSATRACLDERRVALVSLLAAMTDAPDDGVVRGAITAAGRLAPLAVCQDSGWLSRHPAGDAKAELSGRQAIRTAAALQTTGRSKQALQLVEEVLADDATVDAPRLHAEALILAGEIQLETDDTERAVLRLAEGFDVALALGDDDSALEASTELVYAVGALLRRFDEAQWWARVSWGLLARLDQTDSNLGAALHSNLGVTYEAANRPDDALAEHRAALAMQERHLGPGHPELAFSHNNIGTTLYAQGHIEEAAVEVTLAASILEATLGANHPDVALAFNNLAHIYKAQGRLEEAERAQRRGMEIFAAGMGPTHSMMATMRSNLGATLLRRGQLDAAQAQVEQGLAIAEAASGPSSREAGQARHHLGKIYAARGQHEAALGEHTAALKIAIAVVGPEHPRVAVSHQSLAKSHEALGQIDQAQREYERALAIHVDASGADHPATASVQLDLGTLLLKAGERARALPLLEAAGQTITARLPADHPQRLAVDAALVSARAAGSADHSAAGSDSSDAGK